LFESIKLVVQQHEALRATFSSNGEDYRVSKSVRIEIPFIDLTDLSPADRDIQLSAIKRKEVNTPFDFEHGPLFRAKIVQKRKDLYYLFLSASHLVCDSHSWCVLVTDLGSFYSAICREKQAALDAPGKYSDYLKRQSDSKSTPEAAAARTYLLARFSGHVPTLDVYTDRPRASLQSHKAAREEVELAPSLVQQLKELITRTECDFEVILTAALEVFLSRITGQYDIVLGLVRADRPAEGRGRLVGLCEHLLPLRCRVDGKEVFLEYLKHRTPELIEVFSHQPVTFGDLANDYSLQRDTFSPPQVSVVLNVDRSLKSAALEFENLDVEIHSIPREFEHFELYISASEKSDNRLVLECQYHADLFDADIIRHRFTCFEVLLAEIVANPGKKISKLAIMPPPEREKLLVEWNDTAADYSDDKCIHELIEAQVEKSPQAVALTFQDQSLTYDELNRRANQLGNYLSAQGVGPETLVAICVDRSIEMLVGLLGILKAGGAYVPLDPAYPKSRLSFMLEDCQSQILVTQDHLVEKLPDHPVQRICLDADWEVIAREPDKNPDSYVNPNNLAYVVYTSGTTGKPKGVQIEHRGLCNLTQEHQRIYDIRSDSRILQFASLSFDVAFCEIFMALANGATLCLGTSAELMPGKPLATFIQEKAITHASLLPSALMVTPKDDFPDLEVLIIGSEPCPRELVETWGRDYRFFNLYGLTETTIDATYAECVDPHRKPPIGRPLANYQTYILDANLEPLPIGEPGELFIGGVGVARGYLNRPDQTKEKFLQNPFGDSPEDRLYRTGDLARYLPDGDIEFLGRIDQQVKVRGYRIELGEIEFALDEHPEVQQSVVVAIGTDGDQEYPEQKLVAYVLPEERRSPGIEAMRRFLADRLPEYMLPAAFVEIDSIPSLPNGKIDIHALPAQDSSRPELTEKYIAPQTELEKSLTEIWADLLKLEQVGVDDNFFDMGGNSLLIVQMAARIQQQLAMDISLVRLFQYPNIRKLAAYLNEEVGTSTSPLRSRPESRPERSQPGVAIIGMACRFPGANSIEEFWDNLCEGVESVSFFSEDGLAPAVSDNLRDQPEYVRARGILADVDKFDAPFFGFSPRMAEITDPQQRVFLEIAWAAIEGAGYDAHRYPGLIGVFAGLGFNTYYTNNVQTHTELLEILGETQVAIGNEKDFLPTQVSYKLDLKGPSVNVNTACSTSLVAVAQAYHSLVNSQCDMALAGGISITVPQASGYLYQEGGMLSIDGHTRAFDAAATGTVFGNGAGVVLLKRLDDALADRDQVYAVIRGVGLNNDGADKVSFTAPSVNGQATAIAEAQASADFPPWTITYIETHGTGTPLGDPIEVEALRQVFERGTQSKGFCAIGSVKSNIGHAVAAAGVAGLIKTSLALKHKTIPASLFFEEPNPRLDLEGSPFYVNAQLSPWEANGTPRRAGVSSFGVGGTNAHVVLEEAPTLEASNPPPPWQTLLLSGKTETALEAATLNLKGYLESYPQTDLADTAYTLQVGRREFEYRRAVVVKDLPDAIETLTTLPMKRVSTRRMTDPNRELVFLFPGQGAQRVHMGAELYQREAFFRRVVDRCTDILAPTLNCDLRELLYPASADEEHSAALLQETQFTQPALFTIEYALARLWMSWGLEPAALAGHSIGEFVAACLAGVFSLEDALNLVSQRGELMADLPSGSMLSVRTPASKVEKYLTSELSLAADNGPSLCVVSGPDVAIETLQEQFEGEGIACSLLHTSHAFHSSMMDPIVEPFAETVRAIKLSSPKIPIVSTVTGEWMTAEQATDPMYWAAHLRATVLFSQAVRTLWSEPGRVLLEIGPGRTTSTLARQHAQDKKNQIALSSLGSGEDPEWASLMMALAGLWTSGLSIDWDIYYQGESRRRISLPTYPFERKRYWLDPSGVAPNDLTVEQPLEKGNLMPTSQPPISRKEFLIPKVTEILSGTLGVDLDGVDPEVTFLEMGLDSLSLTQVATALKNSFGLKFTFRQLLDEYASLDALASALDAELPPGKFEPTQPQAPARMPAQTQRASLAPLTAGSATVPGTAQQIITHQLQIMARQLEVLGMAGSADENDLIASLQQIRSSQTEISSAGETPLREAKPAIASLSLKQDREVQENPEIQDRLEEFIEAYNARTKKSKQAAQQNRTHFADPPTVSGFSARLKELVYPIVVERSAGSKLWDIDGNEYVDLLNGFGSSFFGFGASFIVDAIEAQLKKGIEIGPQTPLASEVAAQIGEMVDMDRATFCVTGTEAVMGALRLARTVTGRDKVVIFSGSYHGHTDEVILRSTGNLRSMPASPGVPLAKVENTLVLDYGTDEALEIIQSHASELAAVLVEPVQSRHPEFRPKEFLHQLRQATADAGCALIFDEVITGFRTHPGGAQAYFGIKADLATYGKVIGGGLPIGVIAGTPEYMDALDGGTWQFGDDSVPEVGVTYYAGTFFRHPLALASTKAALDFLVQSGPELQHDLNCKADEFAAQINAIFRAAGIPLVLNNFGSMMYLSDLSDLEFGELLIYWLRNKGVHMWVDMPCFLTIAHSDEEIQFVVAAFDESVREMKAAGFLVDSPGLEEQHAKSSYDQPPVPGARLGKDPQGNPAWYIEDPDREGKYMRVTEA